MSTDSDHGKESLLREIDHIRHLLEEHGIDTSRILVVNDKSDILEIRNVHYLLSRKWSMVRFNQQKYELLALAIYGLKYIEQVVNEKKST
jgi:hypothetical protein